MTFFDAFVKVPIKNESLGKGWTSNSIQFCERERVDLASIVNALSINKHLELPGGWIPSVHPSSTYYS
jgi:hypothetical protein